MVCQEPDLQKNLMKNPDFSISVRFDLKGNGQLPLDSTPLNIFPTLLG